MIAIARNNAFCAVVKSAK